MTIQLVSYLLLVSAWIPLLFLIVKLRGFLDFPIYSFIVLAIFLFNIIGSIVVFVPVLNIYGVMDLWSIEYFYIHFIQLCFLYLYIPAFIKFKKSKITNVVFVNADVGKLLVLCFAFILGVLVLFSDVTSSAPIWDISNLGSNSLMMSSRKEFFDQDSQFLWLYRIAIYTLPQILSVVFYLKYLAKKNKFNLFLFLLILVWSVFFSIMFLHKTPLLMLLLSLGLAYFFYHRTVNFKYILIVGAILIFFLGLMYLAYFYNSWMQIGSDYKEFFILQIVNRIFGVYPISTAQAVLIANDGGYWMGEAKSITYLFDGIGESRVLTKEIHMHLFGYTGNAPASALGFSYVDFGYFGVIILNAILLLIMLLLDLFLRTLRNSMFRIALTTFFILNNILISMSSFSDVFTSSYKIATFLGIFILYNLSTTRYKYARIS